MRQRLRRWIYERPMVVAVAVAAIHLAVAVIVWAPVPHAGGDNTAYLALARSLLDHGQYLELWDPARPVHTQYPPGFPALLAVAWAAGLRSWTALQLLMIGLSAGAVGLSYLWLRHRAPPAGAFALSLILAVAPGLAMDSQWILSDMPFWVLTMAALLALARGRTLWGAGLAFLALAFRSAGLPLLVAISAWLALRRRWRGSASVLAGLGALGALWWLRSDAAGGAYLSQLWLAAPYRPEAGSIGVAGLADRVLTNISTYSLELVGGALTGLAGTVAAVAGVGVLALAVLGFGHRLAGARTARSREGSSRHLTEIFTVLYTGMVLVWPTPWASTRFILPLLPILLAYAADGTGVLPGRARLPVRMAGPLILLGLAVPGLVALGRSAAECRAAVAEREVVACGSDALEAYIQLARWTRDRLPETAVMMARKPRQWYWFSGHPARVYPFAADRDRLLEAADSAGARYVVVDELGASARLYLRPALRAHADRLCVVQQLWSGVASASLLGIRPVGQEESGGAYDRPVLTVAYGLRLPMCPPDYRRVSR